MNKEVYKNNIKAYEKRYGKYVEIEENKYENVLEDCKSGDKTLRIEIDNKKVYLNSKYNPKKEAEKYYSNMKNINYGTIILIFGFGLSYHIQELLKKLENKATLLIYENDLDMFDIVMKNIDISNILENKEVFIFFENLKNLENLQLFYSVGDYDVQYIPVYKDLYIKEYKQFMEDCLEFIKIYRSNLVTIDSFKLDWARNNFANIRSIFNCYKLEDFKNIFKDKPIIVVGAGPSLNKNVKLLKKIQGKICIISAFSAAKVLEENNIKPNFLTTIDSRQYGIKEFEKNIPIICTKDANKELLLSHRANKIISLKDDYEFLKEVIGENFVEDDVTYGCGTVSFFSTDIARFFGASEIILIGQDFCWTKEKIHADGTVHKATKEYLSYHHYRIKEKDIYGNTVYVNEAFKIYKKGFDEYTKILPYGVKLIQATEGGLAIEGAETSTLQECIDIYCKEKFCDVENIINSIFNKNKVLVEEENELIAMSKVKKVYNELKKMKKLLKEASCISKELLENVRKSEIKNNQLIIERLDNIDIEIKKNDIIKSLISSYTNEIQSYFIIDEDEDEKINFAIMNEKLYTSIDKAVGEIIEMAKEEMGYTD
ncbi:motility associated factor glycosyltransferase family protein [[Clostridium] colinum]|uniref:motility associated factor glycosyltransferase family protein n=1 Tax=[Clostridium] colinum TaxID=36835 RepID=UPI00202474A9|nr:6-hydroxymethylpterin diphosphokinase MptE-like protein [[Clostridium] colinum]